jgi:hypothetical protein
VTNPNACRWCGIDQRPHGRQYTKTAGWHTWGQPTADQIRARMLARHTERNEAPMPIPTAAIESHPLIVKDTPDGRDFTWEHPASCTTPDCAFAQRIRRAADIYNLLTEGRPEGTYLMALYGFNGLCLISEDGRLLPFVDEPAAENA